MTIYITIHIHVKNICDEVIESWNYAKNLGLNGYSNNYGGVYKRQSCIIILLPAEYQTNSSLSKALRVHAYVISSLDHANSLFYGCAGYLINRLQVVQNHVARVILECDIRCSVSSVLTQSHWLPVEDDFFYSSCEFS